MQLLIAQYRSTTKNQFKLSVSIVKKIEFKLDHLFYNFHDNEKTLAIVRLHFRLIILNK